MAILIVLTVIMVNVGFTVNSLQRNVIFADYINIQWENIDFN